MNKKGMMLTDVMLAVAVLAIIITSLLTFFDGLNKISQAEQMAAVQVNQLHRKIFLLDESSLTAPITIDTNLLDVYEDLSLDMQGIERHTGMSGNSFTLRSGLKLYFVSSGSKFSCIKFISFDLGYPEISTNTSRGVFLSTLNTLAARDSYCSAIPENNGVKLIYLRD